MEAQKETNELVSRRENGQQAAREAVPPPVDIYENAEEVLLVADLPGVLADDVHIRFERGELMLWGKRLGEEVGPDFARTFRVSGAIDPDKIEADLQNGVLNLRLPKRDTVRPRQIPIKTHA